MEAKTAFYVPLGQRQLFLDDYGIAHIENLNRAMHQPKKCGAIIKPDIPSDGNYIQTRAAPMWIPNEGVYKMVYKAIPESAPKYRGTALAISKDGIHWEKPDLGLVEVFGSRKNNRILLPPGCHLRNAVYDPNDSDPSCRYKALVYRSGRRIPLVSPDCLHWQELANAAPIRSGDEATLTYEPEKKRFIAIVKGGNKYGRATNISFSKDFLRWSTPRFCFGADAEDQVQALETIRSRLTDPALQKPLFVDPDPATGKHPRGYESSPKGSKRTWNAQCYTMGVFPYEGLYIGWVMMFYPTGQRPWRSQVDGFHLIQLVVTRDLDKWQRLGNRGAFIGPSRIDRGVVGVFDRVQMAVSNRPLEIGDELYFYYTGFKYRAYVWERNADGSLRDPNSFTTEELADQAEGRSAICLAILRRDGFISLDASDNEGTILTQPFTVPGKKLFVNVDASKGELRAQAVDKDGKVLVTSTVMKEDLLRGEVKWQNGNISDFKGKVVSIRFVLRNAAFYSYWFDEN